MCSSFDFVAGKMLCHHHVVPRKRSFPEFPRHVPHDLKRERASQYAILTADFVFAHQTGPDLHRLVYPHRIGLDREKSQGDRCGVSNYSSGDAVADDTV